MRISIGYLKNFIDISYDIEKIIKDLTLNGFEVEGVFYPYKNIDEKIKIVEILSVRPHPSTPELSLVDINDGKDKKTVVCGAKNAREGTKTIWAPPGSVVQGFEIREKEFKGIKSPGMLLSLEELGLEEKSDGIWLFKSNFNAGTPLTDILKKDTIVIEINITPNRGDALSYLGIARELSAYYNLKLQLPPYEHKISNKDSPFNILIENQRDCPLYQGTYIEGVKIRESDISIQKFLIESGLRPVNNIVDISNFIMLETGHPNHTFDFSYIKGRKIVVRNARNGEKIKLLNGTELTLTEKNLLICDEASPVALAGIMGGEYSSILNNTKSVLLECAIFNPDSIRLTSSMYNISSDSSYRFARGVNPATVDFATKRFMYLLRQELPEADIYKTITIKNDTFLKKKRLTFRYSKSDKLLGREIDRSFIKQTLNNLGIETILEGDESVELVIPLHRYDISVEEDIVEEIARIYGYNNFGLTLPHTETSGITLNLKDRFFRNISHSLRNLGLNEVINYTFIPDEINSIFSDKDPIIIKNPIAQDMASMRKSIIPSLLSTAITNINRQNKDIRIFETGKIFFRSDNTEEIEQLGILLSGKTHERLWAIPQREFDFFDLKGIIENLFTSLKFNEYTFSTHNIPTYLHPGKSASLMIENKICGILGELHPSILKRFDLKQNILIAEINLNILFEKSILTQCIFKKYSPYPPIDRDLAIVLKKEITSEEIISEIKSMNISIVEDISIFDLYEGIGIEQGYKSIGIALRYRSAESTLKDEEVEKVHSKIIDNLLKKFYAKLR